MFKKKSQCSRCKSKVSDSYDFCPHCGKGMKTKEQNQEDFGMLGNGNEVVGHPLVGAGGFGITDKMINSLMRNLVKSLDKQMGSLDRTEVQNLPNGINIRFGVPAKAPQNQAKKQITVSSSKDVTSDQVKRMSGMPRVEAETNVRRLSDKVLYELKAAGISSPEDVFISKLESGYEVKAIGKDSVYVNSLPVNLPLKGYALSDKGLVVEFSLVAQ